MPAKKINLETKTQEVKARKSTAPATKKSPKTAPKTSAKSKKPTPVKVAKSSSPAPSPVFSQDQVATRLHMAAQKGRQDLQWRRQNIGQHRLVSALGQVGQARIQRNAIGLRVEFGGCDCGFIDVNCVNGLCTKLGSANGQDA
jgi:hypothetical protein